MPHYIPSVRFSKPGTEPGTRYVFELVGLETPYSRITFFSLSISLSTYVLPFPFLALLLVSTTPSRNIGEDDEKLHINTTDF
jgi:hypothetical protein